jgi:hypothetical protein
MTRQAVDDKAAKFVSWRIGAEVAPIRAFLKGWSESGIVDKLIYADPVIPPDIDDGRKIELATSLVAVAEQAGSFWTERTHEALVAAFSQEEETTDSAKLLASIKSIFETKQQDRFTSMEMVEYLLAVEDSSAPWAQWWEKDIKNGQTLKPKQKLASMLHAYGIKPKNIRFETSDGPKVLKGYELSQFTEAFKRYVPKPLATDPKEINMELL